jgi:mRNA-degrading endonuclease RelE of RelBE toxin-antitoxin system
MAYRIEISKAAQNDLARLDRRVLVAVRERLQKLAERAGDLKHLPLKGDRFVQAACVRQVSHYLRFAA